MRHLLFIALSLISLSSFSQAKLPEPGKSEPTVAAITKQRDTITVVIRTVFDTTKVKFWYESGDNVKVYNKGFLVRGIETNSAHPEQNRLISAVFYDEKMRVFTKPASNPQPR